MVILILTLVFLFALFGWQQFIFGKEESYRERERCIQSIDQSIQSRQLGTGGGTITCGTEYLPFEGDDIKMKNSVARALYTCWNQWKEGKLKMFDGYETFCHLCTVFEPKDEARSVTGLPDVLSQLLIPQGGQTYAEYLGQVTYGQKDGTFTTNENWAVVFKQKVTSSSEWTSSIAWIPQSGVQSTLGCTNFPVKQSA